MKGMQAKEIKELLEEKTARYNCTQFIHSDPISVPHSFQRTEDIEVAAFFAALFAWGQRITAIRSANRLMEWMDLQPYEFIRQAGNEDIRHIRNFVHRTFNGDDGLYLILALQSFFLKHYSLGRFFQTEWEKSRNIKDCLVSFRNELFAFAPPGRTSKHISDPGKGSSAKRMNMFLRWMVRSDNKGVDFGLWRNIPPSALQIPLDIHSGRVARNLGLLKRKQNDWQSVEELTAMLREFDPEDPVKYDFALFGIGIFEGIKHG